MRIKGCFNPKEDYSYKANYIERNRHAWDNGVITITIDSGDPESEISHMEFRGNMVMAQTLTDEQKQGIETAIKTKFCGSENEVNFMLYWKSADGQGIDVQKIESDETPERYIAIKDNARQNIFISMKATPLLFGLPNAANGFSTQEYNDSYKLYHKSVVEPVQDIIFESIDKMTGIENTVEITPFSITFDPQ